MRFRCGRTDVTELPSAYKGAAGVIEDMRAFGLADVVDRVLPYGSIMVGDWECDPALSGPLDGRRLTRGPYRNGSTRPTPPLEGERSDCTGGIRSTLPIGDARALRLATREPRSAAPVSSSGRSGR